MSHRLECSASVECSVGSFANDVWSRLMSHINFGRSPGLLEKGCSVVTYFEDAESMAARATSRLKAVWGSQDEPAAGDRDTTSLQEC